MKKVLFGIICIAFFTLNLPEQSFAGTLSFKTMDGRVFCETDRFDGSYAICSKEQLSGTGLSSAGQYAPQFMETATQRICVEKGKEVDANICNEKSGVPVVPTKPIAITGATVPVVDSNTGAIQVNTPVSTGTISVASVTSTGIVVPELASASSETFIEQTTHIFMGFVGEISSKIEKMSGNQIVIGVVASFLSLLGIVIYYIIRRRRQKRLAMISPVIRSPLPANNGGGAPHRVVNRWVLAPPPQSDIMPQEQPSSLFPPPPPPTPTSNGNPKPSGPPTPQPSSFLANHLGEL